ncbi:MAG: TetR/AcrR family transcriptional regulator [Sporichthyaceae bacterium]
MPKVLGSSVAEHRQVVLRRVYSSFERLVYAHGYDAITLAEIAKEADLARTAMYNYFPDKETLLLAYTEAEMDGFFSRLRVELDGIDDPIEQLRAYVGAQLHYFATHHLPPGPGLRSVLSERGYAAMRRHAVTLEVTLQGILTDAVAEGQIPPEVAANPQTIALINASLSAGQVREHAPGPDLEAAIAGVQEFVLRAVGATVPSSAPPPTVSAWYGQGDACVACDEPHPKA